MSVWREHCRKVGIGEISIYAIFHGALNKDSKAENLGIDGFIEFPPHHCKDPFVYNKTCVHDYMAHAKSYSSHDDYPEKCMKAVMLGWDNTARKGEKEALVFNNFHALEYFKWLGKAISYTRKNFRAEERFVFINAWNEWAEGTYLEPDKKYGYNSLNITSRAIFDLRHDYCPQDNQDERLMGQSRLSKHPRD